MRRLAALAATAALGASTFMMGTASAAPPEYSKEGGCGAGESKTARGVIMIGDGKANGNTLYVDDRDYNGGNGVWLYKEGNKYDFLQRGGGAVVNPAGLGNEVCTDPAGIPEEEATTDETGNPTWKPDMCIF